MDLTALQYILYLAVIPLALALVLALLVLGPGWTRAGGYRPGEPWDHEPIIINAAETGNVQASIEATPDVEPESESAPAAASASFGSEGGASARW